MFLVAILLYSQYKRYGSDLFTEFFVYSINDIPLGYCRISALLVCVYVFTKNKYLAGFLYFQSGLAFFSVLFPGGDFFVLTENHRVLGYVFDHYIIALMPIFLIFIDGLVPTKKTMYFSIAYSLIIPFSLLPYALNSGKNVYYILDGAFIPMVFGNNQVVISIVYIFGIIAYNISMYLLSIYLVKLASKHHNEPFFKPLAPWILISSFTIIGIIIGGIFINSVPTYIQETTDSYTEQPIKKLERYGYVFEGKIDSKEMIYIELRSNYDQTVVMDDNGDFVSLDSHENIFYFEKQDINSDYFIVLIYKDKGTIDEKVRSYIVSN